MTNPWGSVPAFRGGFIPQQVNGHVHVQCITDTMEIQAHEIHFLHCLCRETAPSILLRYRHSLTKNPNLESFPFLSSSFFQNESWVENVWIQFFFLCEHRVSESAAEFYLHQEQVCLDFITLVNVTTQLLFFSWFTICFTEWSQFWLWVGFFFVFFFFGGGGGGGG